MPKVVIVGGGWSGCAAALAAVKAGAEVTLLERTDMLLGTGLVGGIFRNNGRFTATEEAIAMGGGELFHIMDAMARHKNVDFPGHKHASLYDVINIEPEVRKLLEKMEIKVLLQKRVVNVRKKGGKITAVILEDGREVSGDAFVDCSGTAGGPVNCVRYGHGCVMCILRCHAFGERVSITERAGIKEKTAERINGTPGRISGGCILRKDSVSLKIQEKLEKEGVFVLYQPQIEGFLNEDSLRIFQRRSTLVLLDVGSVKLRETTLPLEIIRKFTGLSNVQYEDPLAGGIGNSVRFMAMAPRDNTLKVEDIDNLFCAGEKAGPIVGHTEAIVTGLLAGHNAVRSALRIDPIEIPKETTIGDFIAFVNKEANKRKRLTLQYTFSSGVYFERMKKTGFYSININDVKERVDQCGCTGLFSKKLVDVQS